MNGAVQKSANAILVSVSGFYDTIFHTMLIFGGLNFLVIIGLLQKRMAAATQCNGQLI